MFSIYEISGICNMNSSHMEERELQLFPLGNKIMRNSRSNRRQRYHPWHYSNLRLTTNARLRGL